MVEIYAILMIGVIGFQVALILGAPWGRITQGGQVQGALPMSGRIVAAELLRAGHVLGRWALAALACLDRLGDRGRECDHDDTELDHPLCTGAPPVGTDHDRHLLAGTADPVALRQRLFD